MTGPHVTITDPDEPLIPGLYFGSSLEERSWALHVTAGGTTVEAVEDHPDEDVGVPIHLLQQALTDLTVWARMTGRPPASDLAVYDHLRTISADLPSSPEEILRRLVTDRWQLRDAGEAHQQYIHDTVTDALKARGLSRG